jgi:hypothetical protein
MARSAHHADRELWQRRMAIQIAAQLPDNPEYAREVLKYAMELVDTFLSADSDRPPPRRLEVVQSLVKLDTKSGTAP